MELWPLIKDFLNVFLMPVIGVLAWIFKGHHERVMRLDARVTELEKENAIISTKLDSIDEKIDDIKKAIEKIADKR